MGQWVSTGPFYFTILLIMPLGCNSSLIARGQPSDWILLEHSPGWNNEAECQESADQSDVEC
jgi:hypothetical protein